MTGVVFILFEYAPGISNYFKLDLLELFDRFDVKCIDHFYQLLPVVHLVILLPVTLMKSID